MKAKQVLVLSNKEADRTTSHSWYVLHTHSL